MGLGVKMRKAKKFRTLKELYGVTSQVEQPKSTAVWEGCCTFRGPVDETEGSDQMDMGLCGTEEQLGRQFPGDKCNESEETRACNGIKDEASAGKEASRCSFDDANVLCHSKSGSLNDKHHACSETSNPLSSCSSSHNSFSENADSKSVPKGSDISEVIGMPPKEIVGGNCVLLDQHNKQKEIELLGDNVSCVSRADGTDVMLDDHRGDASRNNLSCSSASVNSFPADVKDSGIQYGSHHLIGGHCEEVEVGCQERPIGVSGGTTQGFSDLPKKLECTEELSESTLTRGTSVAVHSYSETLEPVAEIEKMELSTDTLICSDQKVHSGNSYLMLEEPKTLVSPPSQSDINVNKATNQEIDVKVCDICGDEGHRHKLAICSKCSDGAEHIYCMRVKLDKVPDGYWMCEVCTLKHDKENPNKVKCDKSSTLSRKLSFNNAKHDCKGSSTLKLNNHLSSGVKHSTIEKGGASKTGFASHCSAKRSGIDLQGGLMKKRRVHETTIGSSGMSSPSQGTVLHRDSQLKSLDKGNTMVTGKKISLDDHSSRIFKPGGGTSLGDHTTHKNSGKSFLHRPHSVKSKPQNLEGHLYKSKSFNGAYSKVGFQLPVQGGLNGPKITKHAATSDSKDVKNPRRMLKSKSFNNGSSHRFDACHTKLKMVSPSVACSDEVGKSKHAKEWSSSKISHTSQFREKVSGCGASPMASDRRLTSNGASTSQPTLVSKSLDMRTSTGDANGSLGRRSHLIKTCSKHSNKGRELVADDLRQNAKGELPKVALDVVIPDKGAVPELDYVWRGGFELKRSGKLASSYDGIQAHLSTCASPKVLEVVDKLPHKVMLEEVPRSSIWPTQFLVNPVTENNIALYFFAKDIKSYERDYKVLLECMTENDIALKGNVDGIELLIFSSSLLPQESQRWNRLLFLWGLFRVRRSGHVSNSEKKTPTIKSESIPTSQEKTSNPSLNLISPENCVNSQLISNVGKNISAPNLEPKLDPSEKMSFPNPVPATPNIMPIPAISRGQGSWSSSQLIGSVSSSISTDNVEQISSSMNPLPSVPVSLESVLKVCEPEASTTNQKTSVLSAERSQQPSVVNMIQTEQLSGDVLPFKTMLQKDSKRRLEIDLNSSCEEQITDSEGVYEEQEPKRTKNCLNAVSETSTESKDLADETMIRINRASLGFSVEDHKITEASKGNMEMPMPMPNLDLSLCSETKRPAIDLELSLGAEEPSIAGEIKISARDEVMFGKYSALASSPSVMPLAPYQFLPEGRKSLSLFGHCLNV